MASPARRLAGRVWLDGLASYENRGEWLSHLRACACVLGRHGQAVDWDWLMGVSGEAFCYYYHPQGTFLTGMVHSWDSALAALRLHGLEGQWRFETGVSADPALAAIEAELAAGRPAIAPGIRPSPDGIHSRCHYWFVVTGVHRAARTVTLLGAGDEPLETLVPYGDDADLSPHPRWHGIVRTFAGIDGHYGPKRTCNPLLLVRPAGQAMDPAYLAQQALSQALALARETSTESVWGYGRGVYLAGLTALRQLQHDLAAAQGDGVPEYRAFNPPSGDPFGGLGDELSLLLLLADRRASAAGFVEQASAVLPGSASGHLMAAATHYRASALEAERAFGPYCGSRVQWQSALALLEQPGGDQSPAWQGFWASAEESLADRATRAQMAEHVARVVAAEAAAVEELEHTLESIRR